jgi:hypothetical protein
MIVFLRLMINYKTNLEAQHEEKMKNGKIVFSDSKTRVIVEACNYTKIYPRRR